MSALHIAVRDNIAGDEIIVEMAYRPDRHCGRRTSRPAEVCENCGAAYVAGLIRPLGLDRTVVGAERLELSCRSNST